MTYPLQITKCTQLAGLALMAGLLLTGATVHALSTFGGESKMAASGVEMRGLRRAGIGFVGQGIAGIAGVNLEINFTEQTGISGGFGLSSEFQSVFLGMKHVFLGKWFLPYASGSYARWFSSSDSGPVRESTPGFLAERFLRESEKSTGKFSKNLLVGSLGIQYVQLDGDWVGASLYAEALLVVDIDDFLVAPTAGIGTIYYF